ncbi:hypothetical protein IB61_09965 [Brucella abortus LMN2]|nr:hypothetical protein IB61_09965 [Brucella abortus LMN2]
MGTSKIMLQIEGFRAPTSSSQIETISKNSQPADQNLEPELKNTIRSKARQIVGQHLPNKVFFATTQKRIMDGSTVPASNFPDRAWARMGTIKSAGQS